MNRLEGKHVVVTGAGTTERAFRGKMEQDCWARDAVLVGDDVYAVVVCPTSPSAKLVRIDPAGTRTALALAAAPAGCEPRTVEVRGPSDLWVSATCGVFRLGHSQPPLRAP